MPELIINARNAALSTGLNVKRILPFRERRMVGPFIFLDHAGPVKIRPDLASAMDVLPHPHIGLSTVTYLLGGQVTHRDSLGVEQIIRPGEVNWMTAGKGISHSERFEDPHVLAKGEMEMLQTWVALPDKEEETNPSFTNFSPNELPVFTDKGIWMRLIAGEAYGLTNKVKTHSPLFYLHIQLEQNTRLTLPANYSERAVYIVKGSLLINLQSFNSGQMLVFNKNEDPVITVNEPTTLMLLGGEPLGPRYIWWNFVSSRKERIEQAKADWQSGRIILPPNDNTEFIPLPNDKSKPSEPPEAPLLS
ncbi:MAG: pirin family protein [Chitinophagaceae bacterium]|nr:pirin family protein [Bacteroidota bacterium]MCC6258143.1 pirin family protein [Chitinophagaceae bacterium]MCW5917365.1 pirin family protein [Ferruginibacter sp.]